MPKARTRRSRQLATKRCHIRGPMLSSPFISQRSLARDARSSEIVRAVAGNCGRAICASCVSIASSSESRFQPLPAEISTASGCSRRRPPSMLTHRAGLAFAPSQEVDLVEGDDARLVGEAEVLEGVLDGRRTAHRRQDALCRLNERARPRRRAPPAWRGTPRRAASAASE